MMRRFQVGLGVLAVLAWAAPAQAQFGGLKKAVKGAVEQKMRELGGSQGAGGRPPTVESVGGGEGPAQAGAAEPAYVNDQGVTSEVHRQNLGHIVFSKQLIEKGKEQPGQFASEFTLRDPIHSRFYLARSIKNECIKAGETCFSAHLKIRFIVNGEEVGAHDTLPDREWFSTWTTFRQESLTDAYELGSEEINGFFLGAVVPKLKEGKNDIKVKVTFVADASGNKKYEHNEPICEGEFSLVVGRGEVERFLAEKAPRLPEPRMKNPKLEAEMLQAIRDAGWKEEPLKAVIIEDDWTYERNRLTGIIVSRHISAAVLVKSPDGQCRLFYVGFGQENQGGNKYGKARLGGVQSRGPYDVPCSAR